MQNDFPDFIAAWDKNVVTWTGNLQPTPLSKNYTIRIVYSLGMDQPDVTVISPKLEKETKYLYHMCTQGTNCVFFDQKERMDERKVNFKTIVPWTSLWLYYYELWHVTGEWLGGGEHPNKKKGKNIFNF